MTDGRDRGEVGSSWIALLRGVNVGGGNRVPMAELRTACGELGWHGVQTYIQSGNVLFYAQGSPTDLAAALEKGIQGRFGLSIPVVIRAAAHWPAYVAANPYPEASRAEPNRVMLSLSRSRPAPGAVEALAERATAGERITLVDDGIWVHYGSGVGGTRLSPALFDRLVGSPVTARNWRTVLKLDELARGMGPGVSGFVSAGHET
jgi:uncharacterized protein (DUF1697 family)